jgi:hypothetical protein
VEFELQLGDMIQQRSSTGNRAIGAFDHARRASIITFQVLEFKVKQLCILGNECEEGKWVGAL